MSIQRHHPNTGITPLTQADREAYPSVIYQQQATSPDDTRVLIETTSIAAAQGLPFIIDTNRVDKRVTETVIRSSSTDRRETLIHSALFHGAATLVRDHLPSTNSHDVIGAGLIKNMAAGAVVQIVENEDLRSGFAQFYSGLRWHSDQEKFITTLFEEGTELDLETLDKTITSGRQVYSMSYGLDHDLPYETTQQWDEMSAQEVFNACPEFDYHQLTDPAFRNSDQGKKLEKAYQSFIGQELSRLYISGRIERDEAGNILPKPILPLSRFPLIESLIVDEILMLSPKAKYDFGPTEVTEMILRSDSVKAQRALVIAVTTRIEPDKRHVYDGPDELQQKHSVINDILRAYQNEKDASRKTEFKDQIIQIINAYTNDGGIASDVRQNYQSGSVSRSEIQDIKNILGDILRIGLASPDAVEIVGKLLPVSNGELTKEPDPLALTQTDFQDAALDSIKFVDEHSDPTFIKAITSRLFGHELGAKLQKVAEMKIEACIKSKQPEVALAHKKWSECYASFDDEENKSLREAYMLADTEGKNLRDSANHLMNEVILELMENLLSTQEGTDVDRNAKTLLEKIYLGDSYDAEQLPDIYNMLIDFAGNKAVSNSLRASILWRFAEHYKYASEGHASRKLTRIIIDGYRLMLGDPSQPLSVPDAGVSSGLRAINQIASHNVFKQADESQLFELSRYRSALLNLIQRFTGRQLTTGRLEDIDLKHEMPKNGNNDTTYNIQSAVSSFIKLEEQYREFLYLEEVKHEPHIYYPWIMKQLTPFWQKMQWEVGPGNRPRHDIQQLYDTLNTLISEKLVVEPDYEFTQNFDPINDGNIDELLLACYEQMVIPYDIKHNGTVWREGMTFVHMATAMMPKKLLASMIDKYGENNGLVQLIINTQKRFNKEDV